MGDLLFNKYKVTMILDLGLQQTICNCVDCVKNVIYSETQYDIQKDTIIKRTKERWYLMSLKIDEYLSASQAITELQKNQTTSRNVSAQDTASEEKDSYVSTIGSSDEALPSENYNDILKVIQKAKAGLTSNASGQTEQASETEESGQTEQASGTGAAGGAGGSSESENETTTKTVVINGVTYLETTTVENGVTSVQRTAVSGASEK